MAKQKDDSKAKENEAAAQRELNSELGKARDLINEIVASENKSLKTYADRLDLTAQLNENAKILATLNRTVDRLSTSQSDRGKLLTEQYTTHRDLLADVQSKYVETVSNSNKIAENQFETVDLTKEHQKLLDAITDLEERRDVLKEGEYKKEKEMLNFIQQKLDLTDKINASQERANELAMKFLDTNKLIGHTNDKLIGGIEHVIDSVGSGGLGIIGSFLGKKANALLEQTRESIQEKVVHAFQESGDAAVNAFSLATMSLGSFIRFALPALGIAGLLGAFGLLIHTLSHLDAELSEIGKEFGVSRKEADKLHHVTIDIANEMNLVGIRSLEVLEAVKNASAAMGGLNILSRLKAGSEGAKQLVKDFAILETKFGLSTEELSNIQSFAAATGKSIGQVVKETTKLGKGLFSSKQAIGIIAKISPTIALSFRRGSQELIKAAQKAKLLGTELEDIQSFGDNILDIETSIQAEMQARALTGKNINLDAARYYALTNDVAGLQEELLKNLGSSAEFGKMNRIQQQSLAAAFGMQVDDVSKLLLAQEKLEELGISQNKLDEIQQMNAEQLASEMRNTNNEKLRGYLEVLKREQESASINERLSNIMTKIKEKIAATVSPLLEMAHAFFDSAEGGEFLDKVIKGVKDLITIMIPVVKFLAENIWLVVAALAAIGTAKIISGITSVIGGFRSMTGAIQQTSDAAGALGKSGGGVANATNAISGISSAALNGLVASVAMVALAGAVYILSQAFQEFSKVSWEDIGKGTVAILGLIGISFVLAAAVKVLAIAAVGLGVISIALNMFGEAVMKVGTGMKDISGSIESFGEGISKIRNLGDLSSIGKSLKDIFSAMSNAVSSLGDPSKYKNITIALKNLGIEKLIEFGKLAKTDLGKAGENIVQGIKSLSQINVDEKIDFGTKTIRNMFTGEITKLGTGVIGAFEQLNTALGQVKLDNVEVLAKVASTDMSKLGTNLQKGIESLGKIDVGSAIQNLENVSGVFEALYNALVGRSGILISTKLDEYSFLDPLKGLLDLDISKLQNVSSGLKAVIYNLSDIGKMGAPGLESLRTIFENLSISLNKLDITKLSDLANVNVDNLRKLSGVFQQPVGVTNTVVQPARTQTTGQPSMQSPNSDTAVTNKKLDEAIGILRQILSSADQPVIIKVGDRTIESIGGRLDFMKNKQIATDNGYGRS